MLDGGASAGSSLDSLRQRFQQASRLRTEELLRRHGHRLTPAERESYEKQCAAGGSLLAVRRRLLDRLLRAAALRRRSRRWAGLETLEGVTRGPYNDRAVLEETLHRTATSDPEWTREFLDLYAEMKRLGAACESLLPGKG